MSAADHGDHLEVPILPAARREDDRGAGDEADPPGHDSDFVVADLDDQAPHDTAHDRGDESRRHGREERARRLGHG